MKEIVVGHYLALVYERYQALSLRERILITLAVLSVTWMAWEATVGGFLASASARIERDTDAVYARLQAAVEEQSRLQRAKNSDPNVRLNEERDRLEQELRSLNSSIGEVLDRFVEPERMPALLQDVIRHHEGLKLKRMETLPVEAVVYGDPHKRKEGQPPAQIYRHPLRIEFEGDYFAVLAYLAELEQGPWELGWRRLNYVVGEYPLAEVTIEIETLSREKNWIGV
ncbi:MAG: hypothetical protein R3E86_22380 [Pseudomonadales bacterium]